MTVLSYIKTLLSVSSVVVSDEFLEAQLISHGLEADNEVTENNKRSVREALFHTIPVILTAPRNISEGGYSISYDKDSLRAFYKLLANELGLEDMLSDKPKYKDISNRW